MPSACPASTPSGALRAGASSLVAPPLADAPAINPVQADSPTLDAFPSAEEAWYWTLACLAARHGDGPPPPVRPCRPEDVLHCLDRLYRRRRVQLVHIRIMRLWGERGRAPNPAHARERCDWRFWREAMDRLEWPLRQCGIVAGPRAVTEVFGLRRQ